MTSTRKISGALVHCPLFKKQCNYIIQHLPELVGKTILEAPVITFLQSRKILGEFDVADLMSIANYVNRNQKFYTLVIPSRPGSYEVLIEALEATHQMGVAQLLKTVYDDANMLEDGVPSPRKYARLPPELEHFIKSDSDSICIVKTLDVKITCDKLKENVDNYQFHSFEKFLTFISTSNCLEDDNLMIHVVTDCTNKNLKLITRNQQIHQSFIKKLLILIHCNKEDDLWKPELPSSPFDMVPHVCMDKMEWDDLSPAFMYEITRKLEAEFKVDPQHDPHLELNRILWGKLLTDLINQNKLHLFKDTLPDELSYYVERTLLTRNSVSLHIFSRKSSDIYLVTGVERHELVELVPKYRTENSSSQLTQRSITVRFMILDQPNHFEKICEKTSHPVHLLHYEGNRGDNLQWVRSRGEMTSVQQNIDVCQDSLCNEAFMRRLGQQDAETPNMPLCLSDSPGMGKSVLLAQIGRKLVKIYPDRLVLYIAISEFIRQIKQFCFSERKQAIELTLLNLSCENELGKGIMKTKLASEEVTTELLLDGFDEVSSEDLNLTYAVLQEIQAFKSIRLWITSRPHLLAEVENTLSVLGYKMKPFSEEDQLRFLTSFWSREDRQREADKLTEFAQHCLNNLKSSGMSAEQDIAGIPLQCLLIGEVYQEEAINYATFYSQPFSNCGQRKSFPPTTNPISSITSLYQKLIQNRIKKYAVTYGTSALDPTELMEAHIQLSLKLLFPQHFKELDEPTSLDEVLKVGLLESESTVQCPRFIHRTFAEYFVAWLMADWLMEGKLGNGLIVNTEKGTQQPSFVFQQEIGANIYLPHDPNTALTNSNRFVHQVICYFLNSLLAEQYEYYPMSSLKRRFEIDIMFHSAKSIAHACAIQDFLYIFKVLVEMSGVQAQARNIFDEEFLLITIEHSCLELVKLAFDNFEHYVPWSSHLDLQTKVLRAAVRRGELSIVEFLIKDKRLRGIVQEMKGETGKLLHDCVENTLLNREGQLDQKSNIIRMLVGINEGLLETSDDDGRTPLLCYDVHVQLLIQFVELGADVFAQDKYGATILQYPLFGQYSNKSHDYHLLITSIPEDKLRELVGSKKHGESNPLWRLVERIDPCPETLELFHSLGADFNDINRYGYSVLACAVKCRRNGNTIRKLMELGAELGWRGRRGETLLHVSAGLGNLEGLRLFLKEGIPVNVNDDDGLTPLDYAIKGEKIGKRFETGMALYEVGGVFTQRINSKGQSLLHIAGKNGNMDSVQLLLKLEFDVNLEDNDGNTPLHLSAVGSEFSFYNFDTVGILLESDGINPNALNKNFETPFHFGLLYGKNFDLRTFHLFKSRTDSEWTPTVAVSAFKFIISKMEDLYDDEFKQLAKTCMERGASLDYKDEEGNSLLHQSAYEGNHHAVEYLVEHGMSVNERNKKMETPLHTAALAKDKGECLKIIKYLIDKSAAISAKDEVGRMFLHKIPENITPSQYHDLAEYLIERKYSNLFNATCWEYECTPFQRAVFHVELKETTLHLLYSNAVDFNAVDKHGSSVLVYAVRGFRSQNILSSLIQWGADLRNLNNNRGNLLQIASVWGNVAALEFFLDRGGLDPNEVDGDGDTALHTIMLEGRKNVMEMSRLLVRHGADLNISNYDGLTPLAIALKRVKDKKLKGKLVELLSR